MEVSNLRHTLLAVVVIGIAVVVTSAFSSHRLPSSSSSRAFLPRSASTALLMTEENSMPATFREAEVLGLKLMQDGDYQGALEAFKTSLSLPGSKKDVVRTKLLQGPSPVGGASGGTESRSTTGLDEFELQAAHYNLACAYSQIGQVPEAIAALQTSLENGFDNFGTIRSDPDLAPLRSSPDFDKLMAAYEPSSGFNPFGLFGKK